MQVLSERLVMTQLSENDWDLFYALHTNPDVISLCFDEPSIEELKDKFESRLPRWSPASEQWLCLTIAEKGSEERIGITGFCVQAGVAEVGFMLHPKHQGLGFGTESLIALIEWAKTTHGFNVFNGVVTEGNVSSENVLIKSGFSLTNVIPDAYEIGGKLYADHIYCMSELGESL